MTGILEMVWLSNRALRVGRFQLHCLGEIRSATVKFGR
jgi:hypothetical protein